MLKHFGRFDTPEVVHTDRGTAFHNELITELLRVAGTEQSLSLLQGGVGVGTAYSKEENTVVERANTEVLQPARVHTSNYPWYSVLRTRWRRPLQESLQLS